MSTQFDDELANLKWMLNHVVLNTFSVTLCVTDAPYALQQYLPKLKKVKASTDPFLINDPFLLLALERSVKSTKPLEIISEYDDWTYIGFSIMANGFTKSFAKVDREQLRELYPCPFIIITTPDEYQELIQSNPLLFDVAQTFNFC